MLGCNNIWLEVRASVLGHLCLIIVLANRVWVVIFGQLSGGVWALYHVMKDLGELGRAVNISARDG